MRYDVEWQPVERWIDAEMDRLEPYIDSQPIGDYYRFAVTGGGDPWCWKSSVQTGGDEYEIHEVDLFRYRPFAPTFGHFVFRNHLRGIKESRNMDSLNEMVEENQPILDFVLSSQLRTITEEVTSRVSSAFERGEKNPLG